MDDYYYMKTALALAEKGKGFTSPNPIVGAVVVKEGKIVGKGWHWAVGSAHAEVNAIDDAGAMAKKATLYVNLEPCNHTGRTPPCTAKIITAGISRIVVAMRDPNPDVKGGGIERLKEKGIDITLGICEDEARKLNESFIKHIQTGRPFVILKCAVTLDGQIATKTGDSKWVSGEESRKFVHRLRHAVDAIMVGIRTVKQDDPRLTARLEEGEGSDPTRIILDTSLSIDENAAVLNTDSASDTLIITGGSVPQEKKGKVERKGVKIIEVSEKDGLVDLDTLMDLLGDMGITSLLIEGGSRVAASALTSGIVDKILLFYGPKILGGNDGVPVFTGKGPELMKNSIKVNDVRVRRFDNDVLIEGYISK